MTPPVGRQQRGAALVTALLVLALAGVLATELFWDTSLDLRRTQKLLERDQAQQVALGMELGAGEILRADFEADASTDSLTEQWALPEGFSVPLEGGSAVGHIEDLQGRFNLNSLVDDRGRRQPQAAAQFRRLVARAAEAEPGLRLDADSVVDAVVDWLDPDQLPEGIGGAEDGDYTERVPPYRAANTWFITPTELLAVEHVTPELYTRLAPLVTALPPRRVIPINVNTALPEVLASLSDNVSDADVQAWLDGRSGEPYEDTAAFLGQVSDDVFDDKNPQPGIDVGSQWFGLTVIVSIGSTRLGMYSLLERNAQDGGVTPRLRAFDTP